MFRNIIIRKRGIVLGLVHSTFPCKTSSSRNLSVSVLKTPHHVPLTKIVATIGPQSEQLPVLKKVVDAGMKIMRINFSHATYGKMNYYYYEMLADIILSCR